MRTRVYFHDAVGKTVEDVHEPTSVSLLLTFTDGTYAHIEGSDDSDWNECDMRIRTPQQVEEAVKYGVLTAEEGDAKGSAALAAQRAATERLERAEYERLRAKFGG
jgi:hypothetical protein